MDRFGYQRLDFWLATGCEPPRMFPTFRAFTPAPLVLPRQILQELQANLSEEEIRSLFRLLSRVPERLKINWDKTKTGIIAKYRRLGCKLGDAVIAAHLEELGIEVLVTENRDFLEEIENLPFRTLNAAEALAELKRVST